MERNSPIALKHQLKQGPEEGIKVLDWLDITITVSGPML